MDLATVKTETEKIKSPFTVVPPPACSCRSGRTTQPSLWQDHTAMHAAVGHYAVKKLVVEFHERTIKVLGVCNSARDGVDQVRRFDASPTT